MAICRIDTCVNHIGKHGAKGLCSKHYKRYRKHGDPNILVFTPRGASDIEALRFKGWTVTESGCWEWNGHLDPDGYGVVSRDCRPYRAHRLSYEVHIGPIPEGRVICHTCDNRKCINPDHLFHGTSRDNTYDALAKDRLARDEKHGMCKISSNDVLKIRDLYATGRYTQRQLAGQYGISQSQVSNITRGVARRRAGIPLRSA